MSISKLYIFTKNTDANASIRGYQYQILKTLETWLINYSNNINDEIFCDYEDDIFEKNELTNTAKFRQIKLYSSNFSFKSEEIEKCIAHFFMLHVKTDYTQLEKEFIFEANTRVANKYLDNGAELLRKWNDSQNDLKPEFLKECSAKVKEIVSFYIHDQAKTLKEKIEKKTIEEALAIFDNLEDADWDEFTKRIKWNFLNVTPEEEFQTVKNRIETLIISLPFPIDKDDVASIFGLLYSIVWEKASEINPDYRKLVLSEIELALLSVGSDKDKWYLDVFEKWKDISVIDYFFIGEFYEVLDAAKHCRRNKYLFVHSEFWLSVLNTYILLSEIAREYKLRAIYEYIWLNIKYVEIPQMPEGSLIGSEEYVRCYFENIDDFKNPIDIEDAQNILNIALAACSLGLSELEIDEVLIWFKQIETHLNKKIAESQNPNETCHLLEELATENLFLIVRKLFDKKYDSFIEPMDQLLSIVGKANYYNVSQLCYRLNAYIKILITLDNEESAEIIELIDSYLLKLDTIVQNRDGNYNAAKMQVSRGVAYIKSTNTFYVLKALNSFHKAKDLWNQQETIEGFVLALINIAQLYSAIGLNFAAKYYALSGVWISVHNGDKILLKRIADSLGLIFYADFKQGSWMSAISDFQHYIRARHELNPRPLISGHEDITLKTIGDFTLLTFASPLISSQLKLLIDSQLASLGYIKDEYIEPLKEDLQKKFPTSISLKEFLENKLTDKPLNDIGKNRVICFMALGSKWEISFQNDFQTNSIAEEFCAILQIMLAEIALSKYDFHLFKSTIILELEIKDGLNSPKQLPSHSKFKWKVYTNYFDSKDPKEVEFNTVSKASILMVILNNISLLPDEEFQEKFEDLFKNNDLATKTLSLNAYQKMYRMVFSEEEFNILQREYFNFEETAEYNFPQGNSVLKWKDDISIKYDNEQTLRHISNRYKYSKECIHLTLTKLSNQTAFKTLIIKLRQEGWQDWQIVMSMMNFMVNYKAQQEFNTLGKMDDVEGPKKFQELFFKYQKMDEIDCYIEFPVKAFESPDFNFQLESTCVITLKSYGLKNKASFPNFSAVKEFLDIRFNVAIDKNDEENPLLDIKD